MIPCINPKPQNIRIKNDILHAVEKVIDSGWYILGKEVESFETEFASYVGAQHCVGIASGTDAILLALKALEIGEGDEVITVSHTAVATVTAIVLSGATPVFVDIEEDCYTIDPKEIQKAITPKTKAVVCVHLYGQMCAMDEILAIARNHSLYVVEDCAQAAGSEYRGKKAGSIGDIGCFSFFPTKNLGAIGDGGAITTSNPEFMNKLKALRQYGWNENRLSQELGYNSRLDELQAAVLRVKLRYLDLSIQQRIDAAKIYNDSLPNYMISSERLESQHSYHLYVIRSSKREQLSSYLRTKGVMTLVHYKKAAHQHPVFSGYLRQALPVTELIVQEILSLPLYADINHEDVRAVSSCIKLWLENNEA